MLALLREDDQVPDVTIKQNYENLRTIIETWIDDNLFEDERSSTAEDTWDRIRKHEPREHLLRDLRLGRRYNTTWLSQQRYRNVAVVTFLVWRFLQREIFDLPFPMGTDGNGERSRRDTTQAGLLHGIYEVLNDGSGSSCTCRPQSTSLCTDFSSGFVLECQTVEVRDLGSDDSIKGL